jgi:hypothetical protein
MPIKLHVSHCVQDCFGMVEGMRSSRLDSYAAGVISESPSAEDSVDPIHADPFIGLADTVTPLDLASLLSTYDMFSDLGGSDIDGDDVSSDDPELELPRRFPRNYVDV